MKKRTKPSQDIKNRHILACIREKFWRFSKLQIEIIVKDYLLMNLIVTETCIVRQNNFDVKGNKEFSQSD